MRPSPMTDDPLETLNEPDEAAGTGPDVDLWSGADRLDEQLHYGRAWHRYRYCFRRAESLWILDAGCGTGRSAVWAARLNPGASVLGVDASAAAIGFARERAEAAGLGGGPVEFRVHDPAEPV